jgi:hypothetical protein
VSILRRDGDPAQQENIMVLSNVAAVSLVVAIFSGSCAFGVGDNLARIMRPITYAALAIAAVLYVVSLIL